MSFSLSLSNVSVEYDSAAGPIIHDFSLNFPHGWTGVIGANGSGKSTLLKLIAGELREYCTGTVRVNGKVVFCEQNVDVPPAFAQNFLESCDSHALRLAQKLSIVPEMLSRWQTLSMGERKKIQIGTALFLEPDILCIDEPTNHLDSAARNELARVLLSGFRGTGILVSHDRELLDMLCEQCLFIHEKHISLRAGGVTQGLEEEELEQERQRSEFNQLKSELKKSKRELQRSKEKEQKAEQKNSKRKLDKKDHDGKGKIDLARVSGKDRRISDMVGNQSTIVEKKRNALDSLDAPKTVKLGLNIPYGVYSTKNRLLEMDHHTLSLGPTRRLILPDLEIRSDDRIALTGVNGAGKSTLITELMENLKIPKEQCLYLPQEIDLGLQTSIRNTVMELPKNDLNKVMSVVASLGSRPDRILASDTYSPGEWRKLFFGLGVLRKINLIILDEPTNHLDLPSIQCLEVALKDCDCALFLISHDMVFLKSLCRVHWKIERLSETENILTKTYMS